MAAEEKSQHKEKKKRREEKRREEYFTKSCYYDKDQEHLPVVERCSRLLMVPTSLSIG
jgi:hypothetical protein